MKRVIIQSCLNICMYFLGAALISSITDQIRFFDNDPVQGTGFNLTLELPLVLPLIFIIVILTVMGYLNRTNKESSFSEWSVGMTEFSDQDEREEVITGKATRVAYTTLLTSLTVSMIPFSMYTRFPEWLPNFPFYAIATVLSLGTFSYMAAWVYHYQE